MLSRGVLASLDSLPEDPRFTKAIQVFVKRSTWSRAPDPPLLMPQSHSRRHLPLWRG